MWSTIFPWNSSNKAKPRLENPTWVSFITVLDGYSHKNDKFLIVGRGLAPAEIKKVTTALTKGAAFRIQIYYMTATIQKSFTFDVFSLFYGKAKNTQE